MLRAEELPGVIEHPNWRCLSTVQRTVKERSRNAKNGHEAAIPSSRCPCFDHAEKHTHQRNNCNSAPPPGRIAQSVERCPHNAVVQGSSRCMITLLFALCDPNSRNRTSDHNRFPQIRVSTSHTHSAGIGYNYTHTQRTSRVTHRQAET